MLIRCDGFWSYITNENLETIFDAKQALTVNDYNFQTQKKTAVKFWVTHSKVLDIETIKFPTGLCDFIQNKLHLEEELRPVERQKPTSRMEIQDVFNKIHAFDPTFDIRDYQLDACLASLNQYQSLIYSSTGSGKTSIMSAVVKFLKNDKILIVNDNGLIINQIYKRLLNVGIDSSEISNTITDLSKHICVLSSDMLYSRLHNEGSKAGIIEYLQQVNTIICDECQHFQALTSFLPLLYTVPGVLRHVIGYSGSPFRDSKRPLSNITDFLTVGLLGMPAFTYDMKDAMNGENVAQAHSYFINYNGTKPNIHTDNYYVLYKRNIQDNWARNKSGLAMLRYLNSFKLKTLALFNHVEKHALPILQKLALEGIKAVMVRGGAGVKKGIKQCVIYEYTLTSDKKCELLTKTGSIDEVIEKLKDDYNIVFASSILNEGVDISLFDAGILFSGGKSPISITQQLGRVSRKKSTGLNVSLIIDFKDINCDGMFIGQYNKRRQILAQQGVKNLENVQEFMDFVKKVSYNKYETNVEKE